MIHTCVASGLERRALLGLIRRLCMPRLARRLRACFRRPYVLYPAGVNSLVCVILTTPGRKAPATCPGDVCVLAR